MLPQTIANIIQKASNLGYKSPVEAAYHIVSDTQWTLKHDLTNLRPWEVRLLVNFTKPGKQAHKLKAKVTAMRPGTTLMYLRSIADTTGLDLRYPKHLTRASQHLSNHLKLSKLVKACPYDFLQMS